MVDFSPFNWECPHCQRKQTITKEQFHHSYGHIFIKGHDLYPLGYQVRALGCANQECKKLTVMFQLNSDRVFGGEWEPIAEKSIVSRRIIPESGAKPQPEYIPSAIREDYYEACRIRDLSPKASATLARRCLQGMIRDFCQIKKSRLIDEIRALSQAVDEGTAPNGVTVESVQAIDNVREVGNIGAHMEQDISVIVPVDPHEAQLLIELIESLFEEWYVSRETRRNRLESIKALSSQKGSLRDAMKDTGAQDAVVWEEENVEADPKEGDQGARERSED